MVRAMTSAVALLLPFASALVLDFNAWGPSDSVHALDGVIAAVNSIVNNPSLDADHLKKAKQVAADVKSDIEAVEGGHLTKQQTKEKVGGAMKELTALAAVFTTLKEQASTSNEDKLTKLKKELAEKQKALAKVESMMKLLKLKKALAEKKLLLEKLIAQKSSGHKAKQDMAESSAVVSKLLAMANNITGPALAAKATGKDALPAPLKAIVATLQAREKVVSDSLARMIAEQTKGDAQIDAVMKEQMAKDKDALDSKKRKMIKHLKTEENRKFAKARALRQHELDELKDAEKDTKARDVKALTDTLSKMQHESRQMQAKSGDFLH